MSTKKPETIDEYIADFPKETQKILKEIRAFIKKEAPAAGEKISYGIPTFTLNGTYLVYFAGFKSHIGFYPTPVGMEEFKKDLAGYKTGKGSVQFPLNEPMPWDLMKRIVRYRIEESKKKEKTKKK